MASHDHWKSTGSKDIHHEHCNISSKCVTPVARKEVKRLERSLFGLVWNGKVDRVKRSVTALPPSHWGNWSSFASSIDGLHLHLWGKARRLIASGNEEDWARLLVEDVRELAGRRTGFPPEVALAFPTVWRRGESLAEDIMAALKRLEAKIGATLTVEGERALPTIVQRGRER